MPARFTTTAATAAASSPHTMSRFLFPALMICPPFQVRGRLPAGSNCCAAATPIQVLCSNYLAGRSCPMLLVITVVALVLVWGLGAFNVWGADYRQMITIFLGI